MFEARVYFKSGAVANVKMKNRKDKVGVFKLTEYPAQVEYFSYLTDEEEDGLPVYRPKSDE